jgi:hypothetical protein
VSPSATVANLHADTVSPHAHAVQSRASVVSRRVNLSHPAGVAMTTVIVNIATTTTVIVTPAVASCVAARHVTPAVALALRGDVSVLMIEVRVKLTLVCCMSGVRKVKDLFVQDATVLHSGLCYIRYNVVRNCVCFRRTIEQW